MTCGFKLKVAYYTGLSQPHRKSEAGRNPPKNVADFKARFEDLFHGCRRLSTHGCDASCLYTSGTGGRDLFFIFYVIRFFFPHVHFSRTAGGRTGLPGALYSRLRRLLYAYMRNGRASNLFWCLSTFFFFPMYISPGLRGGNHVAGGSLLTGTAILIRIQQAEREGGEFVLVCFNNVIPCSRATGREPGCWRLSTHGCGDFDSHTASGTRGWGISLVCFNNVIPCSRAAWEGRVTSGSLLTVAAILVYISETGERARVNSYLCVFQSLFSGVFSCALPALYFFMNIADKQQDEGSTMCFV